MTGSLTLAGTISEAQCPFDKKLIAGGCETGGQDLIVNRPSGIGNSGGWACKNSAQGGTKAYAWCCK